MDGVIWKVLGEYGLAGGIFLLLFFCIKWILEETKKILERESVERKQWTSIIQGFQKNIADNSLQLITFQNQNAEAHKYQKQEHEKMISNLDEHYKVLVRINGYKDDHK